MEKREDFSRRSFLKVCGCSPLLGAHLAGGQDSQSMVVDDFDRPDSLGIGDGWESLNPGYWKIQSRALRRRLKNVGDGNPVLWFPWHWETHRQGAIPLNRDLSLPYGMMWRRDWEMQGNYGKTMGKTSMIPRMFESMSGVEGELTFVDENNYVAIFKLHFDADSRLRDPLTPDIGALEREED